MDCKLIELLHAKEEQKEERERVRNKSDKRKIDKNLRRIEAKIKKVIEEEQGIFDF